MIESRLFSAWDGLVGSVALIAIIVLALSVMVRFVKLGDVLRHLGVILVGAILLVMLPAIIASLWTSMTLTQHLGIIFLGVMMLLLFGTSRRRPSHGRRR